MILCNDGNEKYKNLFFLFQYFNTDCCEQFDNIYEKEDFSFVCHKER